MKTSLKVIALAVLTGCATARNNYVPSASSQYPAETQMIADRTIHIKQGPYEIVASAAPVSDLIAVNLEFANNSTETIRVHLNDITLADGRGRILQSVDLDQRIRSLRSSAAKSNDKAKELERELDARDAARKAGKSNKTLDTLDAVAAVLGSSPATYRNEAIAAETKADDYERHRDKSQMFFSSEVAPGQKLGGIVYFEAPAQWPATLMVHADKSILAAHFNRAVEK